MPLLVINIVVRPKRFEHEWREGGYFNGNAVHLNGMEFFNGMELIDFNSECFQSQLCDCCGFEGCGSGSWSAIRKFGEFIIIVPAIESMVEGSWERVEYAPPVWLIKYGSPVFSLQQYMSLSSQFKQLSSIGSIPRLSNNELLAVLQMEAPGRILSQLGASVALNAEPVIAVEFGLVDTEMENLQCLLGGVKLQDPAEFPYDYDGLVKFVLDLPGFPDWTPMVYKGHERFLHIPFKAIANK